MLGAVSAAIPQPPPPAAGPDPRPSSREPADDAGAFRVGVVYATAAFLWWGASPIYWKAVGAVGADELVAHRAVWSTVLLAAILVFTRGGKTEHTWFYNLENDGLSLDDKRQRIAGSELPDLVALWNARDPQNAGDRNAKHFFVPVQEIRDKDKSYDLSFHRYSEVEHDESVYEEPKVILQELKTLEDKIHQGITELEEILG